MLRLQADDPLALSLFKPSELKDLKRRRTIKRGRRIGEDTEEQTLDDQLLANGFEGYLPHYRFAQQLATPTGRPRQWEFDQANAVLRVAIECEGGIWMRGGGAHSHPTNILRDIEKYNAAALLGWTVLRFTTDHVRKDQVIPFMRQFYQSRGWPCPTPSNLNP